MAEIPIERKSGTNPLVWVLLVLALVAVAWWLFARNDGRDAANTRAGEVSVRPAAAPALAGTAEHLFRIAA